MRKKLSILLALVLAMFTLSVSSVSAEDGNDDQDDTDYRIVDTLKNKEDADAVESYKVELSPAMLSNFFGEKVDVLTFGDETYIQMEMPANFAGLYLSLTFNGTEVTWNSTTEAPYIVQYKVEGNIEDEIALAMTVDTGHGIHVYDGDYTLSLVKEEEEVATEEDGTVDETTDEDPVVEVDPSTPDKVYEVNYTILKEDGVTESVADSFFAKPGYILVKNGVKYFQFTITDPDYVKTFKNKYGDYLLVKENEDGSAVYQLKLDGDLSNMVLDMHIVVPQGAMPGFPGYDAEHQAILFIDSDTLKEIEDIEGFVLAGSTSADNESGPFVGTGDGTKTDGETNKTDNTEAQRETGDGTKTDGETNPQTGVKSNILLYVLLLIGSATLLAIQLKRRTA